MRCPVCDGSPWSLSAADDKVFGVKPRNLGDSLAEALCFPCWSWFARVMGYTK